ncbi:MAG TPA: D-alanyl-D-alanine carboxypeptidase family protein [bacterium]|nr:D-alanyl-D-alanine carboxypeptidase family protein [bacterium]
MRAAVACIIASIVLAAAQIPSARAAAPPPLLSAASAILIEGRTRTVLFERAADVRRAPASTTKVLTALLVVERLRPETMVAISPRASGQRSGSSIGLEPGELWRADALTDALMLASANDAALALAEAVGGSVEGFAVLMNQRARAAGATHSTFVVPHGLYYPGHLTTSRDLAMIAREALRHPAFAAVARRQVFTWQRPGLPPRVVVNRNRLLWTFRGADGVKTGWIRQSGQCLVASATRDGRQLIAVVMDSADVFGDAARLLEYGFINFRLSRAAARGEVVIQQPLDGAELPLAAAVTEDLFVVAPPVALRREVHLRAGLRPPIRAGQPVGELLVYAGAAVVGRAPVAAVADVDARSAWRQFEEWMRGLMKR